MVNGTLKTKDIANELQIAPATVLNWAKKYKVPHTKNQQGHFCFSMESFEYFKQLSGSQKEDILEERENAASNEVIYRLEQLEENLKMLERMISNKADEIVSFQVFEHRSDLEQLQLRLDSIEKSLEEQKNTSLLAEQAEKIEKKPRRLLANIFSI
ncbi:hypothetical protein [Alteribacillus sp. HJP-4]|uniref:hypothetical protein n=1 Tax=Alteribacillus sp. HJP-4 TaxID=2775394 RepID=UPI0035CCD12D